MPPNVPDCPKKSPAELLAALRQSHELLGMLLESHREYLLKIIEEEIDPHLKPRQGVSDIVQGTYLRVLENFRRTTEGIFFVGSDDDLKRWLRQVCLNALYQGQRDEGRGLRDFRREQPLEGEIGSPENLPSPSSLFTRNERDEAVKNAVNALPEVDRILLRLREWHNWAYPAIAWLVDGTETEKGRVSMQRRITKIRFELGRDESLLGQD